MAQRLRSTHVGGTDVSSHLQEPGVGVMVEAREMVPSFLPQSLWPWSNSLDSVLRPSVSRRRLLSWGWHHQVCGSESSRRLENEVRPEGDLTRGRRPVRRLSQQSRQERTVAWAVSGLKRSGWIRELSGR